MGVAQLCDLGQVEARGPLQNEAVGLDDPSRQSLPAFSRRGLARPHYAATSAGVKKKANGAPGFCFFPLSRLFGWALGWAWPGLEPCLWQPAHGPLNIEDVITPSDESWSFQQEQS